MWLVWRVILRFLLWWRLRRRLRRLWKLTPMMTTAPSAAGSIARDRFGLGWRPELAAGIFAHLDQIDMLEVIADDYFDVPRRELSALRTLGAQVPITLHGVGAGLASALPVEQRRLDDLARVVEVAAPVFWSEHLAFVRAGNVEIGHLAAPVRNCRTLAGTAENLTRARATVGAWPAVENVATLIDPPGCEMNESDWMLALCDALPELPLLLDLHNVHANALNFGFDAAEFILQLPLARVGAIHIAGGEWIDAGSVAGERRLLDDHLHPVPEPVYELLRFVAAHAPQPLNVLLERDGAYPPMPELLREIAAARAAVARGRAEAAAALHQPA
ncbi:MAG: DUF692 family protein [Verrucomicrobia bacterium]|nr:DUF692 family protein [Verrucomicrobiota bacterium]